jgi:hypothetical protein
MNHAGVTQDTFGGRRFSGVDMSRNTEISLEF